MKKAGFLKRFVAAFIDGILFAGIGFATAGLGSVLWFVYEAVLVSQWEGYTVGKKVMGIKVVDSSGNPLATVSALVRVVGAYVSGMILGIGYLMMLWDGKKQTLHDKMAGSYVVKI